jgi:hypothetical protein
MATTFKHFKPGKTPSSMHIPVGLPITPTMATIVVDGVPIVDP